MVVVPSLSIGGLEYHHPARRNLFSKIRRLMVSASLNIFKRLKGAHLPLPDQVSARK